MAFVEKNLDPVKQEIERRIQAANARRDMMTSWIAGLVKITQTGSGDWPTMIQMVGLIPISGFHEIAEIVEGLSETQEEAKAKEFRQKLGTEIDKFRRHYCSNDPTGEKVNSYMLSQTKAWDNMLAEANRVNDVFGFPQMQYP